MAITGKTGADAIAKSLKHICRVINAYAAKLNNVIDQAGLWNYYRRTSGNSEGVRF